MIRQIRGGLEKNTEGFLIFTSTQSDEEPPASSRRTRDRSCHPRRQEARPHAAGPLRVPCEDGEGRDRLAGPAELADGHAEPRPIRATGQPDPGLRDEKDKGEHAIKVWASQHLNLEIGVGGGADGWIGAKYWTKRTDPAFAKGTSKERLQHLLDRCEVAVAGIDGGGMDDLLGLAVLGREKVTRKWLLWTHAWCHEVVLEERKSIASKLLDLEKAGDLTIIRDEDESDIEELADIIEMVRDAGLLPEENGIGVDPSGVDDIVDELTRRGFTKTTEEAVGLIVGVRQGFTLQNAVKVAERRLAKGHLLHDGSPLMTWCVGNAKQEQKGNSR